MVKGWIVDFYNHHRSLALEVDGGIHDTQEQWEKDQLKDEVLASRGVRIIRIPNRLALAKAPLIRSAVNNPKYSNANAAWAIASLEEFV